MSEHEVGKDAQPGEERAPKLALLPGITVEGWHLELLEQASVEEMPGLGPLKVWVARAWVWPDGRVDGAPTYRRMTDEERRRIVEIVRVLQRADRRGIETGMWWERLESVAMQPNADLLDLAEWLADRSFDDRWDLLERARALLDEHDGAVDLLAARRLAESLDGIDEELGAVLLWLLARAGTPPEGGRVVDWVLAHELNGVGFAGVIDGFDALFGELVGRKPASTMPSRRDRAGVLRLRMQMTEEVIDQAREAAARAARTLAVSPPPEPARDEAPAPVRGAAEEARQEVRQSDVSAATLVFDPRAADAGPEGDAADASPAVARPDEASESQAVPRVEAGEAGGEPAGAGAEPEPSAAAEVVDLAGRIARLEGDRTVLRSELEHVAQRVDYLIERLEELGLLSGEGGPPPAIDDWAARRRSAEPWWKRNAMVVAAVALFAAALILFVVNAFAGRRAPGAKQGNASAHIAGKAGAAAEIRPGGPRIEGGPPQPAPAGPAREAARKEPPRASAGGDGAGASKALHARSAQDGQRAASSRGGNAADEGSEAEKRDVKSAAAVHDESAAQESAQGKDDPEVERERFGLAIEPSLALRERAKLMGAGGRKIVNVTDLPGADAIIGKCLLAPAKRKEYPHVLYQGFKPVWLSCAGEMRAVCDALGCPPEDACVTAAAWMKPCKRE